MLGKLSRPVVTATIGLATVAVMAVGAPTAQSAPPRPAVPAAPAAPSPKPGGNTLPITVPFDNELATVLRFLKQVGGDKIFVEVLQAIIGAAGQIVPQATASEAVVPGVKAVDAAADPLKLLRLAGVQPLSPSIAPFCAAPTPNNPLGLVTAGTAAIPGPWPMRTGHPLTTLPFPLPGVTVPDRNLVKDEHTAFAFVPADAVIAGKRGTMRVAWFNSTTMRGGVADLTPLSATNPMMKVLPGLSGVRLIPVDTGKGTVLAAVYGTAGVGGHRECFFLPSVGVINS